MSEDSNVSVLPVVRVERSPEDTKVSEMVQRIISAMGGYWIAHGYDASEPDEGIARAILEAMREPTEAMLDASKHAEIKKSVRFSDKSIWQAMIDEALK